MSTENLLRAWRVSRNLSQAQIAKTCGCGQFFISRCERGEKQLSEAHVRRLIDTYGIQPKDIGYQLVVVTVAQPLDN